MANLYTYLDNGTWESYPNTVEFYTRAPQSPQQVAKSERSTTLAFGGVASGKVTFLAFPSGQPWNAPNAFFPLTDWFTGSTTLRPRTGLLLQISKRYKIKMRVRTPSGTPIGTDNVPIFIAPYITKHALPSSALPGTRRAAVSSANAPINPVYVGTTVAACKDNWVEISYEFTTRASAYASNELTPITQMAIICASSDMVGAVLTQGVHDAIVEAGTLNVNGLLYIDGVSADVVTTCDLAYGSPQYTKTDETAVDADDGSITVNATSSASKQYRIDNGGGFGAWQNSNVFANLPPGTYSIQAQDLNGCVLAAINNIPILEFVPVPPDPPDPPPPAGVLDINQKPVNRFNFISWFAANGDIAFASMSFNGCVWDLPKPYRVNKVRQNHYPVVVNGEMFSFYLNFDTNYNYANFSSLRLDLITQHGAVALGVGTLERVFQDDGVNYFIYANVTLAGLTVGKTYRLAITDTSDDDAVKFVTQEFIVMSAAEAPKYTLRLRFRCSIPIYRFLYDKITEFFQTIRLRFSTQREDTDGEISQYRAVSSGKLRNVSFDLDMFYEFESYFFDDLAHRAMMVFQTHDIILVNDRTMIFKEFYKVTWDPAAYTNKGTFELYEQEFSTINRYGDPDAQVIQDPVLGSDDGNVIGT